MIGTNFTKAMWAQPGVQTLGLSNFQRFFYQQQQLLKHRQVFFFRWEEKKVALYLLILLNVFPNHSCRAVPSARKKVSHLSIKQSARITRRSASHVATRICRLEHGSAWTLWVLEWWFQNVFFCQTQCAKNGKKRSVLCVLDMLLLLLLLLLFHDSVALFPCNLNRSRRLLTHEDKKTSFARLLFKISQQS